LADPKNAPQPPPLEEVLSDLAIRIERVKQLYEQYFMGIEKLEPLTARKEIQRAMLLLQQEYIRNTGLRFRFQTMLQKWNIYITYWNRILREIENGTYVRHIEKVKRAAQRDGKAVPDELVRKSRPPSGTFDTNSPKRFLDGPTGPELSAPPLAQMTPPPRPAPTPRLPPLPAAPPKSPVPGMSEDELRVLHKKYVDARKQVGEAPVSYEALVNSLAKQAPRVLGQPGVASVKFDVGVHNGRAVLKAIPQKK
jgi:hypothetical protein